MEDTQLKQLIIHVLQQSKESNSQGLTQKITALLEVVAKRMDEQTTDEQLVLLGKYQQILENLLKANSHG